MRLAHGFSQVRLWEVVERLDVLFYLRPRNPLPGRTPIYDGHSWLIGPIWAFGAETSVHALRFIGSGLFDDYPQLYLVVSHFGEGPAFFIVRNEESYKEALTKGVQRTTVGKDFDELMARYKAQERQRNVKVAKGFGVADPEVILDAYARAIEKWQKLSKDIGRDPDKFTDALWREVYSKLDPAKL